MHDADVTAQDAPRPGRRLLRRTLIAAAATLALGLTACVVGSAHRAGQPATEQTPYLTPLHSSKTAGPIDAPVEVSVENAPGTRPAEHHPTFFGTSKSMAPLTRPEPQQERPAPAPTYLPTSKSALPMPRAASQPQQLPATTPTYLPTSTSAPQLRRREPAPQQPQAPPAR